jgi:hypothetical protein
LALIILSQKIYKSNHIRDTPWQGGESGLEEILPLVLLPGHGSILTGSRQGSDGMEECRYYEEVFPVESLYPGNISKFF